MKKVLITGANGFIGRHCLPILLERGYEIHAVSSDKPRCCIGNVHWHQANLLDCGMVMDLLLSVRPTHLLHFAWYTVHGRYWNAVENFRWVESSYFLLEQFVRQGGRRVVMAGTCAEYDQRYPFCLEGITPLGPETFYGECKHHLQRLLGIISERTGLSSAWGRIFFLYGPHENRSRFVSSSIYSLIQGMPVRCSNGGLIRDYLHVIDAASAFVDVLDSDVQGAINIASGRPVCLKDMLKMIGEKMGRCDLICPNVMDSEVSNPQILIADTGRLKEEVYWEPHYNLDEGLDQTIRWWKTNELSATCH